MSSIYSIQHVRMAVARELLELHNIDAAVNRVAEQLGDLPPEVIRSAISDGEVTEDMPAAS